MKYLLHLGRLELVLVPILIALLISSVVPWWEIFEINSDEGLALAHAELIRGGWAIYHDIWTDHAPLFAWLYSGWQLVFGSSLEIGRVLVLLSATATGWLLFAWVRQDAGRAGAWIALVVWLVSWPTLFVSANLIVAIPSLLNIAGDARRCWMNLRSFVCKFTAKIDIGWIHLIARPQMLDRTITLQQPHTTFEDGSQAIEVRL